MLQRLHFLDIHDIFWVKMTKNKHLWQHNWLNWLKRLQLWQHYWLNWLNWTHTKTEGFDRLDGMLLQHKSRSEAASRRGHGLRLVVQFTGSIPSLMGQTILTISSYINGQSPHGLFRLSLQSTAEKHHFVNWIHDLILTRFSLKMTFYQKYHVLKVVHMVHGSFLNNFCIISSSWSPDVFFLIFGAHRSFSWGHWYPCFELLVMSVLCFKVRVDPFCMLSCLCDPQIHLWSDTC